MATKTKSNGQDRKRVSSEKHEINYTGAKVAKATGTSRGTGKRAVKAAKTKGRTVSRKKVEAGAKQLAKR